ncbi:hypothetical protein ACFQDG_12945 [Natronoarchaeum mannanilyticum]|uniref:Uncharacterized protein n=1 Tax=Natronoarchaeum mannanilyticum TaxID=926360 RepID=A0AAV3T6R3_9EURY
MERDEPSGADEYVEAEIPGALYERLEALFREYRGYDPSSVQECLSVVADLAERPDREATPAAAGERRTGSDATRNAGRTPNAESAKPNEHAESSTSSKSATTSEQPSDEPPAEIVDAIDAVFPTKWSATDDAERLLPLVVRRYVAASDADTRVERENAALSAVAAREGTTAEDLRETLVDDVYGGPALPGDLASEFLSEGLEKVERRLDDAERETLSPVDLVEGDAESGTAADEVGRDDTSTERATDPDTSIEPAVDADAASNDGDDVSIGLDLGPGSGDLPQELADEMASDGGSVQGVDERVDNLFTGPNGLTEIGLDSMISGARADCEICGATRSVQSLETTTDASDDRRVDLVCPDCL